MGTGSGAIAIALAKNCKLCDVTALDASEQALTVAKENADRQGVNVDFQMSYWFDQLRTQQFDLIVSNPPYLAEKDPHLTQTSLPFEPITALTSGSDGLDDIRHIVAHSRQWLVPNGYLLLEHGYDQASTVQELFRYHGFSQIQTFRDIAGNDRVTLAQSVSDAGII